MPESRPPADRRRAVRIAVRIVMPVLFALSLWFTFTHIVRFGYVVSSSMEPALQVGDYYTVRLDSYRADRRPERGDVIVYAGPDGAPYVKRVIGLGGDPLVLVGGRVWFQDRWLREPYVKERPFVSPPRSLVVPRGSVFVLGDNRNLSEDSRDYGPVPLERVMGRATKIVWPLERACSLERVEYR